MATHSPITIDPDARRWALGTLGLTESSDDVNDVAMLRIVDHADCVVPPEAAEAIRTLVHGNANEVVVRRERERRLTVAVGTFASSFFDLDPKSRQQSWRELRAECQPFPALIRWLDRLSVGLRIRAITETDDDELNEHVQLCLDIFLAREPDRTRDRQSLLATHPRDSAGWRRVFAALSIDDLTFARHIAKLEFDRHLDRRQALTNLLTVTREANTDRPVTAFEVFAGIMAALIGFIGIANHRPATKTENDREYIKQVRETHWKKVVADRARVRAAESQDSSELPDEMIQKQSDAATEDPERKW